MFGIRLLFVLFAIVAVIFILRRLYRRPTTTKRPLAAPGQMVRCAHCGLYLPRDEALHAGELDFCSPDHRDRHSQA
jgi:uncharacterized protein